MPTLMHGDDIDHSACNGCVLDGHDECVDANDNVVATCFRSYVPSFGCHQGRHDNTPRPLKTWRRIFDGCGRCQGPRTFVTAAGFGFYLCLPCAEAAEIYWKEWRT